MCMSPHEMTSAKIEQEIEKIESWLNDPNCPHRGYWEGRLQGFKDILKERAEDGTYHDNTGRY